MKTIISKSMLRSKLVWLGAAMMLLAFLIWLKVIPAQLIADTLTIAFFVCGVAVIVLRRYFTKQPVTLTGGAAVPVENNGK